MSHVLIIGYGNPLRGDDGVGWRAAQSLERCGLGNDVEVLTCHQLTPELAHKVSSSREVLFVDAEVGNEPGRISCYPVTPQTPPGSFSHQLSPDAVMGLAEELYGASPRGFIFKVCGEDFEIGEVLSKRVEAVLPTLVARVAEAACRPR